LNDELGVYDVEILNHHLKESESCSHISDGEFEIGYGEEYKTLILPLKTNDFTIGKFKKGGGIDKGYMVFNYTDNIYATGETFKTKKEANDFIKEFRNRFYKQGYYRDNQMNKIAIEDIDLLAIPSDFNPFRKFKNGGGVEGFAHLPFGHEIAFSTEGDYDLEIDDFEDKLKIIHKHIQFDNVEGESDSFNTNLKFYKNGKRVASLVGSYNENTETYDSEFVVNDYSYDINFHPYNDLGGLNIKEFDLEIKNAVSESKTYSAVVSIEGYEVEGQEFEDKKRAEVGIKDLKEKTHFNLVKGKRFGQGKRVEQDRVLDKYADGGGVGTHLDLFENYEMMPKNLKKIVDKYSRKYESGNMDYRDTEKFLKEVEAIGYTFDYYLDNEPYGLRPVGVKLNELEGYEDMGEEEYANGGGVEFVSEKKGTLIKGNEIIKYFEKVNGNYRLVFYKLDKAKGKVPKICDAFEYCQELDSNDVTAEQLVELIKKNNLMENGGSIIESSSKSFTYTIGGL
jgi:hypothetical protein